VLFYGGFAAKMRCTSTNSTIGPVYGSKREVHDLDRRIAALAQRQHGVVARRQLIDAYAGRNAIARRVDRRELHPLLPGVYAVGHRVLRIDGRAAHRTTSAFESDRERDRILQTGGWRVIRITWRQLHDQPDRVAADLRRLLG
jgi:uncharacterized protein DUF559